MKTLRYFPLLLTLLALPARAQEWAWAQSAGGSDCDEGIFGVAVDAASNAYVTGSFYGTGTFGDFTLTGAGYQDIVVAKYSPEGEVLWAQRAGGASLDWGFAIAVDAAGNAYVTGTFWGTAVFGPFTLESQGWDDAFVAKYSPEGEVLWAQRAGGSDGDAEEDYGYGVAVDAAGHAYVTGRFHGTATFGDFTLVSAGDADVFVARYAPEGNVQWVARAGGAGADEGRAIAVDATGSVVVTGTFMDTGTFGLHTLTSAGDADIFVARYASDGDVQWAERAGGTSRDGVEGLGVDAAGHAYVTGEFRRTADFGPFTLVSASGDESDIFVAKYGPEGEVLWAERAGGATEEDYGYGIAVDAVGHAHVTGIFFGPADFGDFTLQNYGGSYWDVFVAQYAPDGEVRWVERAGDYDLIFSRAIAAGGAGDAFVVGSFYGSAYFGPFIISTAGCSDVFIARLSGMPTAAEPPAEASPYRLSVTPNPVRAEAVVRVETAHPVEARLAVYDALGREVAVLHAGPLAAGAHAFRLPGASLRSGAYLVRLMAGEAVAVSRVVVLR